MAINPLIKNTRQIEKMRTAGRLAARVLEALEGKIVPGTSTGEIDDFCHRFIVEELDCIPAPLNYKGFPKSVCTSVNHQVCHGIPGERCLRSGDIINVDITVIREGFHGDTSKMFAVGKPSVLARRLMEITRHSMWEGIRQVVPGARLGDIGYAIQSFAEKARFSVVREYCGHGIGLGFHEEPRILHYGTRHNGSKILPGMTFTIEPMINAGKRHVRLLPDGWTVVTKDHSLSAQWEHTILVTKEGYEVLTLREEERTDGAEPG